MDAMHAAIKKKRGLVMGDHQDMGHASQHVADDTNMGGGKDLHGLVASLNDHEKSQLKNILNSGDNTQSIAKGGASSDEKAKIAQAMQSENAENAAEDANDPNEGTGADSDAIAKSMLDSRHTGGNPPTGKPRNLGERMKMGLAAKLKAKGKI